MVSGKELEIDELGVLSPTQKQVEELHAGKWAVAAIKAVADARVGDTITLASSPAAPTGYTEAKPMVFCGLFPIDADQFENLRDASKAETQRCGAAL